MWQISPQITRYLAFFPGYLASETMTPLLVRVIITLWKLFKAWVYSYASAPASPCQCLRLVVYPSQSKCYTQQSLRGKFMRATVGDVERRKHGHNIVHSAFPVNMGAVDQACLHRPSASPTHSPIQSPNLVVQSKSSLHFGAILIPTRASPLPSPLLLLS